MMEEQAAPDGGEVEEIELAAALLGGPRVLRRRLRRPLDVHEILRRGLPSAALTSLVDKVAIIPKSVVVECAGMSLRTFQRHQEKPAQSKPLSLEQSARTWQFAEILAKATKVLGSQNEAEQWLERPALGLDRQRPLELLTTPAGVRLVGELLERMEYGVYA